MKALFREVKGDAFGSEGSLWTLSKEEREETDPVEREADTKQ